MFFTKSAILDLWDRFKSKIGLGPALSELLPDTAAECRERIKTIQDHPRYSLETKAFAIMLLDARAKALQRREAGLPIEHADEFYTAPGMHIQIRDSSDEWHGTNHWEVSGSPAQDEALRIAYEHFDEDPDRETNLREQLRHEERERAKLMTQLGYLPDPWHTASPEERRNLLDPNNLL